MSKATKTYLPLGTVVSMGTDKDKVKLVIYARVQEIYDETGEQDGSEFDYAGVIYPLGYLDDESIVFFNSEAIDEVIHMGYSDDEEINFVQDVLLSKD